MLLARRRFSSPLLPLLGVALGLLSFVVGNQAREGVGQSVVRSILALKVALAPVNDRLSRVALPPIEPFGPTVGARRDHVGPGPLWTAWGGAILAVGSALQWAGGRIRRTCIRCNALWTADRAGALTFCPACGLRVGPPTACAACSGPLEKSDRFCAACGIPVPAV